MSFTLKEYFRDYTPNDDQIRSCTELSVRAWRLFNELGFDPVLTSGFRTKEKQIAVYKAKALTEGVPFDINKVPMGSQHMKACAGDFSDPGGLINNAITDELLAKHDLYREHPMYTFNWVHLQTVPPRSGLRTFKP